MDIAHPSPNYSMEMVVELNCCWKKKDTKKIITYIDVKKILFVTMKTITIKIIYDFRDSHFKALYIVSNINGVLCMISTTIAAPSII